ncbi:MAG: hypothetical protein ACRECP_06935 [Methylocella sp.]
MATVNGCNLDANALLQRKSDVYRSHRREDRRRELFRLRLRQKQNKLYRSNAKQSADRGGERSRKFATGGKLS